MQRITAADSLKIIINYLSEERSRSLYLSDYKEVVTALVRHSHEVFAKVPSIYLSMRDFFIAAEKFHDKKVVHLLLDFFRQTKTDKDLFEYILKNKDIANYHRDELIQALLDKELVEWTR